ncbi:MAG: putative sensory box sensor histidine kinase/response regulator [Gammaproteobacteria bacterium]|jgi:signal transduction histidine kinase/CheY-like chemotaxis protein|nr:putative sensory box sensor histidine kinase/response regulator [Gammaproteobacteria bacterium]
MDSAMNINNQLLLQILKKVPEYIFWKDTNSIYQGCNENFAKLAGVSSPAEIRNKRDSDLPWASYTDHLYLEEDHSIIETGRPIFHKKVPLKYGVDLQEKYLSVSKVPLYDDEEKVIGVLGIFIDITEHEKHIKQLKKEKERAEAASKAKTEFLENMRHDIRTPLVGITGFADIIKQEVSDPTIKEHVDNLITSSYTLLDLLNEVLDSIKVSSGEIPLLKKKFDLKKKLNEIILLNQAKAHQKSLDLQFEYDTAIPTYLIGDPLRIHRIILELVTNALNFTDKGFVKLSVQLAKESDKNLVIKIIVEDTGIGIPKEQQQEIYVQFKRLTPSYKGIYKGLGLGLAIAKQFIEDIDGEMYIESEVKKGTKFTFIISLKKPLLDESLGSEESIPFETNKLAQTIETNLFQKTTISEKAPVSANKSHVLLVEDSSMAAQVVIHMLSALNCIVDWVQEGRLAVEMAKDNSYDLIFMDIGLPDIDGYEITKRIRLNELNKNHVPIIALTAHVNEKNKQSCINSGINAVLSKPLMKEKAEDILNSFVPFRKNNVSSKIVSANNGDNVELDIFNFEFLKKQFGKEEAIQIANLFFNELSQELVELKLAYTKKDWLAIKRLTHKLKGNAGYCGAMQLETVCSKLESVIQSEEMNLFEELYHQLLEEIALLDDKARKEIRGSRLNVSKAKSAMNYDSLLPLVKG